MKVKGQSLWVSEISSWLNRSGPTVVSPLFFLAFHSKIRVEKETILMDSVLSVEDQNFLDTIESVYGTLCLETYLVYRAQGYVSEVAFERAILTSLQEKVTSTISGGFTPLPTCSP